MIQPYLFNVVILSIHKIKESVLLRLGIVVRIMPPETFLLLCRHRIHDQVTTAVWLGVVFLDRFLHAAYISIVNICKTFELLICPVAHHPYVSYDTTTTELGPQLLFLEVIG